MRTSASMNWLGAFMPAWMPGTKARNRPPATATSSVSIPSEEPDLPYDALRLDPLAIFGRREHPFQGRPCGLRKGSLPDHAIARLADLWREVWNFRHAFHFYKLSSLEGRRILRNVHPYPGRGVLHEHVGRIGPHVGVSPQEVRAGRAVIRHHCPEPDGVAARGLLRRELADLADPGQHRQGRTGVRRLGMGGAQGQRPDYQTRQARGGAAIRS